MNLSEERINQYRFPEYYVVIGPKRYITDSGSSVLLPGAPR